MFPPPGLRNAATSCLPSAEYDSAQIDRGTGSRLRVGASNVFGTNQTSSSVCSSYRPRGAPVSEWISATTLTVVRGGVRPANATAEPSGAAATAYTGPFALADTTHDPVAGSQT